MVMQEVFFGYGSISNLKKILERHNPKSVFVVAGKKSYESCGAKAAIERILVNRRFEVFSDFSPNPKIEEVKNGLEIFRKGEFDFIISVGGGSSLDTGKCISVLCRSEHDPSETIKGNMQPECPKIPLVAIPTTSGTGSESTQFAVVYFGKEKYSFDKPALLPDYAIIDPDFTTSLPKEITASTGMDALCQAIESYWAITSTEESRKFAKEAIVLIINSLENDVNNPDRKTREAMALASNLSGKAINMTRTTACHAVSYPITSYFGIPHGHAVGLTLPSMIIFNSTSDGSDLNEKRGLEYLERTMKELFSFLGTRNEKEAATRIENLMKNIGLETSLSRLGINDIEIIIKNGFNAQRVGRNPRLLTENSLRRILEDIS